MRYMRFDPQELSGDEESFWKAWIKRSERAKKKAFEQHAKKQEINLNPDVWKQLKEWLLEHIFHGKCAYCEGKYTAGTYDAAEHWRPKGKVTDKGSDVLLSDGSPHPGYWWLAYDWRNLVPSCDRCNGQKMNEFPVEKSHVYDPDADFDDLDEKEEPLLLHPYDAQDKPEEHLKFGLQGVVAEDESSPRGKKSIKVFKLSRRGLNEARAEEQEKSEDRWLRAVDKAAEYGIPIKETMSSYTGPEARYSQSVKAYIAHKKKDLVKLINDET